MHRADNVVQLVMTDDRVGIVATNGSAYSQDAPFSASGWKILADNVDRMAMQGGQVGIVATNGRAFVQDAPFSASGWSKARAGGRRYPVALVSC